MCLRTVICAFGRVCGVARDIEDGAHDGYVGGVGRVGA